TAERRDATNERELRKLAARIPDEAALEKILDSCRPGMREAVREHLKPYLSFRLPETSVV
ncbi:MAG: hypothetical protein ABFD86_18830, partial [Bryobacteraceae bacterium]